MVRNTIFNAKPLLLLSSFLLSSTAVMGVGHDKDPDPDYFSDLDKNKNNTLQHRPSAVPPSLKELSSRALTKHSCGNNNNSESVDYENSITILRNFQDLPQEVLATSEFLDPLQKVLLSILKCLLPKDFSYKNLNMLDSKGVKLIFSPEWEKYLVQSMKGYLADWKLGELHLLWRNLEERPVFQTLMTRSLEDVEFKDIYFQKFKKYPFISKMKVSITSDLIQYLVPTLQECPNIKSIALKVTGKIFAEVLNAIASIRGLHSLDLSFTEVTDVSVLAEAPDLHTLNLSYTRVTDISALKGHPTLHDLDLSSTGVTDVSVLAQFPKLRTLNLSGTRVTDVSALKGHPTLHDLDLSFTGVTDVSALAQIPNLHVLNLWTTKVTDVSAFAGHPNLQDLYLPETGVTDVSSLAHVKVYR